VRTTPDPAVSELLDNIRNLRLTLTADLAAVAGAIDEDEPGVARDIVVADCIEVRRLCAGVSRPRRTGHAGRRRRRALLMLPAIPLVGALAITGAAAFGSRDAGHSHRPAHRAAASETATSTLRQLERVVSNNPQESRVVALADHLHLQLMSIIATSSASPERLGQVQHILSVEQHLLEGQSGPGEAIALAASRKLMEMLASPRPVLVPTPTTAPTPPVGPTTTATPKPQHSTAPSTHHSPTPKPSPSGSHPHPHHTRLPNPLTGPNLFDGQL
jgi:hypothetical protein